MRFEGERTLVFLGGGFSGCSPSLSRRISLFWVVPLLNCFDIRYPGCFW